MYKRVIALFLILVISLSITTSISAKDKDYRLVVGEVIEVVDSELFHVFIYEENETELLRLIGIDTHASAEAFAHVKAFVNQTPILFRIQLDRNGDYIRDENDFAYTELLNMASVSLNNELLAMGLADLNEDHEGLNNYNQFVEAYAFAIDNSIGIHGDGTLINPYAKKVNINTASSMEIDDLLRDLDNDLGMKIASYVKYNKINNVNELKFIDPVITNEWIDKNKSRITLMTHINTAESFELASLFGSSKDDDIAEEIINYRLEKPFTDIDQITNIEGVTDKMFETVEPFISLQYEMNYRDEEINVVNINTASEAQLEGLEYMTESMAKTIVKYRDDQQYSYKSKEAILKIPSAMGMSDFNKHEDSLVISTDINRAGDYELKSLFGCSSITSTSIKNYVNKINENRPYSDIGDIKDFMPSHVYNDIKPYIYVDEPDSTAKLNLNIATESQLKNYLNISSEDAEKITKFTKYYTINYYDEVDKKVDLSEVDAYITLYTNINKASDDELMMLHDDMSNILTEKLIEYREKTPFASHNELEGFFKDINHYNIYKDIKNFIVFR